MVEHEMMIVGFGKARTLVAESPRVIDSLFDRARQNDLHWQILRPDTLAERESASRGHHVGEHELDAQLRRLQSAHRFVAVRRLEYRKAAFAKIFRQRMTDDDVAFDQKNNGGGRRHGADPFCSGIASRMRSLAVFARR